MYVCIVRIIIEKVIKLKAVGREEAGGERLSSRNDVNTRFMYEVPQKK